MDRDEDRLAWLNDQIERFESLTNDADAQGIAKELGDVREELYRKARRYLFRLLFGMYTLHHLPDNDTACTALRKEVFLNRALLREMMQSSASMREKLLELAAVSWEIATLEKRVIEDLKFPDILPYDMDDVLDWVALVDEPPAPIED